MQTERIILSVGLSPKWNKVEQTFSKTHTAAITRCNGSAAEILRLATRLAPCIVVMEDELVAGMNEDDLMQTLDFGRSIQVLVETGNAAPDCIEQWIRIGCSGVLSVSSSAGNAGRAIKALINNELWAPRRIISNLLRQTLREAKNQLTDREKEILSLVSEGFKNQEIAERLFISPQTVRWHLRSLYAKIGTHDRKKVALAADPSRGPNLRDQTEESA